MRWLAGLADSGTASLGQAILDANASGGVDVIQFAVAGTIHVGRTALPTITEGVLILGNTAPGFAVRPAVRIVFQNTTGVHRRESSHANSSRPCPFQG